MGLWPTEATDPEFVEIDPTGRYGRYNEILGKGSSKTVYKAFDEYEGMEVAWNQVKLSDFLHSPEDMERLYGEIHLLKNLKHRNIMKFYTSWVDTSNRNINFVTEMFTSGTLRQYRQKHKRVNLRAVKHWCRQILRGLLYLHSHDPPVIHRDLKCDNIFVNGNQGEVKIGDLGLAAVLRKSQASHCVGTPEFMAPEVYEERYNEMVDIYSFGMCLLEMVTCEYPYSECTHPAQIYKKVTSGKRPEALFQVDADVRKFVEKCLATASRRLPARELLKDPFLQIDQFGSDSKMMASYNDTDLLYVYPSCDYVYYDRPSIARCSDSELQNEWDYDDVGSYPHGTEIYSKDDDASSSIDISIEGKRTDDNDIFCRLRIADAKGHIRNIYFPFDVRADTAFGVATEMVSELDITDQDASKIADMIDDEISSLVPKWKIGSDLQDTCAALCHHCGSSDLLIGSVIDEDKHFLQCTHVECTAMHGRFEEITYQVERSEHCLTEGVSLTSSHSKGLPSTDAWTERPTMVVLESERDHLRKEHRYLHDSTLTKFSQLQHFPKAACHTRSSSTDHSDIASALSSCIIFDHNENEIRRELRWLKAKYHREMREMRCQQIGKMDTSSFVSPCSHSTSQSCLESTVISVPQHATLNHDKNGSCVTLTSAVKDITPSFPVHSCNSNDSNLAESDGQRAWQYVAAQIKENSPCNSSGTKSSHVTSLFPLSLHRTTSLPVDAVD